MFPDHFFDDNAIVIRKTVRNDRPDDDSVVTQKISPDHLPDDDRVVLRTRVLSTGSNDNLGRRRKTNRIRVAISARVSLCPPRDTRNLQSNSKKLQYILYKTGTDTPT